MATKFDLYETITKQITDMLEAGTVPWRSPILGQGSAGMPKSLHSGKAYRSVNVFLLAITAYAHGYDSSYWMTFKEAQDRGGHVKKGERASMVVFYRQVEGKENAEGEKDSYRFLRYYSVFNACQVEGVEVPGTPKWTPIDFKPIEACEKTVAGYADGPRIERGGSQAFYRASDDLVRMPEPERFTSSEEQYGTLMHELIHSTGHSTRLDRKLDTEPHMFGTPCYSAEELLTEMGAAYLCAHAGISPAVIGNQAAYIQGWIAKLKGDKRLIVSAASKGQKAADWILGNRQPAPE